MKKKITWPDGTVEELEGTAEELAELERRSKNESQKKGKSEKKLLLEQQRQLEEMRRLLEEANNDKIQTPRPWHPFSPSPLPWIKITPSVPWKLDGQDECAIERYFRDNPNATSVGMVCNCRRCTIWCNVSTSGLSASQWENVYSNNGFGWTNASSTTLGKA